MQGLCTEPLQPCFLSVDYDPADEEGFFLVDRQRGGRNRMRTPGPDHPARKMSLAK